MGIIQKQSALSSLVSYAGVVIGAVNSLLIYPMIDASDLGAIQFVGVNATLFAAFGGWGLQTATVHFFPNFKDNKRELRSFFWLLFLGTVVFSLLLCLGLWLLRHVLASFFEGKEAQFLSTLPFILACTVFWAISNYCLAFASNFNRTVYPNFVSSFLFKIAQPILVLLFFWQLFSFAAVFKGIVVVFALISFLQFWYLWKNDFISFTIEPIVWQKETIQKIMKYANFTVLVGVSSVLTAQLDKILIVPMLGYASLAIFSFASFLSEAIDIPRKAIGTIAAPLISESMKKKDYAHVEKIYKDSALLEFIIGSFLLTGLWVCADDLFRLMPKNGEVYAQGKYVILLLGLSRVIDMITGVNHEIITFSEHYRFNLRSLTILAVLNIGFNFLFVPAYGFGMGIIGSALATMLALLIFNIWRTIFIYQKLKIHPFEMTMFYPVLASVVAFILVQFFTPSVSNPILSILLRGSIVTAVFAFVMLFFNVTPYFDTAVQKVRALGRK
jgi:O-antigen/teichoic acid export membrane protein